jgi:hypothetical protein
MYIEFARRVAGSKHRPAVAAALAALSPGPISFPGAIPLFPLF